MIGNSPVLNAYALADTLPPLLVAAKRVAASVMGAHGRRRAGPGETFWQYRAARPGDEARQIDWRQSARSDHLQIRETEWAAAQTVHIWCDHSPGMNWRSASTLETKSDRAMVLALGLSAVLLRAGERVSPIVGAKGVGAKGGAVSGEHNLERVALALGECGEPLSGAMMSAGHCAVLVSDFLHPIDYWAAVLKSLAARGVHGHLLHVMDPAEESFPYQGRVMFLGMGQEPGFQSNRSQDLRAAYRARMQDHCQSLTRLAQSVGWTHLIHRTDHPAQTPLLALYTRLSETVR